MTTFPTLTALEELLADVRDETLRAEALKLCAAARTVESATRLQLQGALASLRTGQHRDAERYIETALDIQRRWLE